MAMNPSDKNAQRVINTLARRKFQSERNDIRDAFKDLKRSGDLSGKEIPAAAAKFKSDVSALQQNAAAATPNSRFFGTMPEGQKKYLNDNFSATNPKPANFKELKQSGFYANPPTTSVAQPPAPISQPLGPGMKKGGKVKMSSASKRADGCAIKGKTRGRMV